MRNITSFVTLCALALGMAQVAPTAKADDILLSDNDLKGAWAARTHSRTSVHDPSVFLDTVSKAGSNRYYVIGSHLGMSYSTNLYGWSAGDAITKGETTSCTFFADTTGTKTAFDKAYSTHRVTRVKNCHAEEVDFGPFDAHGWQADGNTVAGMEWAPDMIYNPTMKKWLLYESLNGDNWCSSVVCFAADDPRGPFVCQGPVVFSGFQGTYKHNAYAAADDWKHTDFAIATGETSLPARYKKGSKWGTYWPNCIDPCVFYDAEGRLWMSYGSWSGGIWMLQLDENTGLRDYTVTYPLTYRTTSSTDAANQTSDPYFGTKIAGGYYVSGEGSYIERFGDYYYLFISYGGFAPDGGYEMRIYRSANPDGPYADAKGISPIATAYKMNYGQSQAFFGGMKLMSAYKWDLMPWAEVSQGHNSAFTDAQGRMLVVYHTKFNDGTAGHSIRVHQLFLNKEGWLVAAPHEFRGETLTQAQVDSTETIDNSEIPGSYQMLLHNYKLKYDTMAYQKPMTITLTASESDPYTGTVSYGNGTWTREKGTNRISFKLYNVEYHGVLTRQTVEYSNIPAVCFSVVSSKGGAAGSTSQREIWGSKAETKAAIKYTLDQMTIPVVSGLKVKEDITLPTAAKLGTTVTWTSSDETILTSKGKVAGAGEVTLTLNVGKDGYAYRKNYLLKVGDYSALDEVKTDARTGDGAAYDLQGRRVDLQGAARGMYAADGKVIIVR